MTDIAATPAQVLSTLVAFDSSHALAGITNSLAVSAVGGQTAKIMKAFAAQMTQSSKASEITKAFAAQIALSSQASEITKAFAALSQTSRTKDFARAFATPAWTSQMEQIAKVYATPAWTDVASDVLAELASDDAVAREIGSLAGGEVVARGRSPEAEPGNDLGIGASQASVVESLFGLASQLTEAEKAFVWWYAAVLCVSIAGYLLIVFPEGIEHVRDLAWALGVGIAAQRLVRHKLGGRGPGAA